MERPSTEQAAVFAKMAEEIMQDTHEEPTLDRIVQQAVEVVPGCDHCAVTLRRRKGRATTAASSSALSEKCDALQYELDQGPCLDAIWQDDSYLARRIETDGRWPDWGPRVADLGIGSVLAIRLSSAEEPLGALNLYSESVDGFTQDDVDLALIFASHATMAMNSARLVSGLETALQSRHLIGVAQGVLMVHHGLGMEQAFAFMRRLSSTTNVKLRDLAAEIVEHRGLPDGLLRASGGDLDEQGTPTG